MYKHFFKRVIDIVLSFIAILILALPMLIIAIIIKIDSPGPVLFKQKRIGIHKKTFTILKFRSMPVSAPHDNTIKEIQKIVGLSAASVSGYLPYQKTVYNLEVSTDVHSLKLYRL